MIKPHTGNRTRVVAALGTAQTLAWASSYYLPAMIAAPLARDLGLRVPTVFAAFSVALLASALLGPVAGHAIDRWGGRPVLMTTNVVFAAGLFALAMVHGPVGLFAAWLVLGVAMGAGLYEAGFATLVRLYGHDARNAITGITLIAGFASTVGWPLSALLEAHYGWRGACVAWAGLHLTLGLALNASLPRAVAWRDEGDAAAVEPVRQAAFGPSCLLAFVFAVTWFTSTAMAAHLPRLVQASGASLATAVVVGTLIGPAQVIARLFEFGLMRRVHPLLSARIAAVLHPLGAVLLMAFGAPAAALFGVLHGAGNGILTIAKGTLPLALFGPGGYGRRQGLLMVPARVAQAVAPWAFGLLLDDHGVLALWSTAALGVLAFGSLALLPSQRDTTDLTAPPVAKA